MSIALKAASVPASGIQREDYLELCIERALESAEVSVTQLLFGKAAMTPAGRNIADQAERDAGHRWDKAVAFVKLRIAEWPIHAEVYGSPSERALDLLAVSGLPDAVALASYLSGVVEASS